MSNYSITDNIIQSIIEYVREELDTDGYTAVEVSKGWKDENKIIPSICINISDKNYVAIEIGSTLKDKYYTVEVDFYCTRNIEKITLTDWFDKILEIPTIPYYVYSITDATIENNASLDDKVLAGKIQILRIVSNRDVDIGDSVEKHKKYHRFISFVVFLRGS